MYDSARPHATTASARATVMAGVYNNAQLDYL